MDYQPELFDKLSKNKKVRKRKGNNHLFRKSGITFRFSYEQIGLAIILLIIFLSVVFTVGVERGKRIVKNSDIATKEKSVSVKSSSREELKVKKPQQKKKKSVAKIDSNYYTVQVVTYRKDSLVKDEIAYLKREGYDSFVIKSGKFKQICVGKFKDKTKAKNILKKLKKRYSDCFIKKVK